MGQIRARAAAVLAARPQDVYATIADYHSGHPSILPSKHLYDLRVEILTTMKPSPGLRGLVERLIVPMANPPIYREELKLLERVAQQRAG